MDFYNPKYNPPTDSEWFKLNEPQNQFRIIGDVVTGYEKWVDKGEKTKQLEQRVPEDDGATLGVEKTYFLAAPVWSYRDQGVRILITGSKVVSRGIHDLLSNKSWGDLKGYDVVVNKKGEKRESKYSVVPCPKAPLEKEVMEQISKVKINMQNMFDLTSPIEVTT